jgi:hypothetical protein
MEADQDRSSRAPRLAVKKGGAGTGRSGVGEPGTGFASQAGGLDSSGCATNRIFYFQEKRVPATVTRPAGCRRFVVDAALIRLTRARGEDGSLWNCWGGGDPPNEKKKPPPPSRPRAAATNVARSRN